MLILLTAIGLGSRVIGSGDGQATATVGQGFGFLVTGVNALAYARLGS